MNTSTLLTASSSPKRAYSIHANGASMPMQAAGIQVLNKLETGIKSIDQLIQRYGIRFVSDDNELSDNAFQKSLILYGQDQRLDYVNLPPCMYMIIAEAKADERFTIHRFYLPYKNGVRFATYLLNSHGDIIESVSYQRNVKYLQAFKVIRKQIAVASQVAQTMAA